MMKVFKRVFVFICFLLFAVILNLPAFAAASQSQWKFPGDVTFEGPYKVVSEEIIDTCGYTLTATTTTAIIVPSTSKLYLKGSQGRIMSIRAAAIEIETGGVLFIEDPVTVVGRTYALAVSSGAEVHLSSGTFTGMTAAIQVADGNFGALLEDGYAYFDANGDPIPLTDVGTAQTVVIKQSMDHVDHIWEETSRTEPTTESEGSVTYTCSVCGETKTETIPKLEECVHDWQETSRTEPTTESEGSITYTCSVCGETKTETIPKLEECVHDWQETSRIEPTAESEGSITYTCSICGETKTETIPKLEECVHKWLETDRIEPTATTPGQITYVCQECGLIEVRSIPIKPVYDGTYVNWLGSVVGLFNMTMSEIIGFPSLQFFAGAAVFLSMFSLLAKLIQQGRKGRL